MEQKNKRRAWSRGAAAAAVAGGLAIALVSADPAAGHGWSAAPSCATSPATRSAPSASRATREARASGSTCTALPAGFHGFHIHANDPIGTCDPLAPPGPFMNVGPHWNPTGALHGGS